MDEMDKMRAHHEAVKVATAIADHVWPHTKADEWKNAFLLAYTTEYDRLVE